MRGRERRKEGTQRGGRKGGREEKGLQEENTERKGGKIRQRREARLQHAGLRERETPAEGASIPRRPRGAPRAASKGLSPRKCTTLWGGRGDGAGNAERSTVRVCFPYANLGRSEREKKTEEIDRRKRKGRINIKKSRTV